MRSESRTFDALRFRRALTAAQTIFLVLLLVLWMLTRTQPDWKEVFTNTLSFVGKALLTALAVYAASAAREGLRYGLLALGGVDKEYLRFGFSAAAGGGFYTRCMAAVDAPVYLRASVLCLVVGWIPAILFYALDLFWPFAGSAFLAAMTFAEIPVLRRLHNLPRGSWVQDSPFMPGCDVYLPEEEETK